MVAVPVAGSHGFVAVPLQHDSQNVTYQWETYCCHDDTSVGLVTDAWVEQVKLHDGAD